MLRQAQHEDLLSNLSKHDRVARMSLAVAIQMDPIESVNIDADSSFVLGLEAQRRGAQPH